jgi:signal transduction histidine kinase
MQTHLITIALAITLLAWVAGVAVTASMAQREAHSLHDREMKQVAGLLLGLSAHELAEIGSDAPIEARIHNGRYDNEETLREDYRYQVWSSEGRLQLTNFGMTSPAAMARLGETGFSWIEMDGDRWRVFSLHSAETRQEIQVAERALIRQWTVGALDWPTLWMVLGSLALVLAPALWLLRRLLRPVRTLAGALQLRSPTNLDQVHIEHVPLELAPVVSAVNVLFHRVSAAIRHERNFTALAAHELRTPLATLRLVAQAAGEARSDAERNQLLSELMHSADRCSRLQDQLLTLSRLDAVESGDMLAEVDMTELVMEAVADILPEARLRQNKLASKLDGSVLKGHRFGLLTLLRNLLSNAVRYTPQGGRIEIATFTKGASLFVQVDDSGPGIPEH